MLKRHLLLLALISLIVTETALRPAAAAAPLAARAAAASAAFRETFEKELDESYTFMSEQLQRLENQGVIELGNFHNLSLDQRIAILSYTYSTFEPVNARLRRGGPAAARIAPYVETLCSALDLLDRYEGVVLRTVDSLPASVLAEHQVGRVVTYPAFTSASKQRELTATYNFTIRSRTGADLDGYASNAHEQEVLFKPGTRFRVLSRVEKDDRTFFELEEVSAPTP